MKVKNREIKTNIPTASMSDIAFLLIVFFMVTTVFTVDRTDVKLPQSELRLEVPRNTAYIVLTGVEGMIKWSAGEEMSEDYSVDDLYQLVGMEMQKNSNKYFVIKADKATPYRQIDKVFEILKESYAKNIYLLTQQETI